MRDGEVMRLPDGYARLTAYARRHHERFTRFVGTRTPRLTCQECGGAGGEVEPILDDGSGPWMECGFCEGTGFVTPHMRGQWLRWKRQGVL